jgi:hypothetical protein
MPEKRVHTLNEWANYFGCGGPRSHDTQVFSLEEYEEMGLIPDRFKPNRSGNATYPREDEVFGDYLNIARRVFKGMKDGLVYAYDIAEDESESDDNSD